LALGAVTVTVALGVFVAWEGFVAARYGRSHFLHHLTQGRSSWGGRFNLIAPLVILLGGVAMPVGLLGLAAWRARSVWVVASAAAYIGGLAWLAWGQEWGRSPVSRNAVVFGPAGMLTAFMLLVTAVSALVRGGTGHDCGYDRLLAAWWLVELAGYFLLTPWPAARRVLGLVVVGTLLVGGRAAATCHTKARRRLVRTVVALSVALGLLYQAIDIDNAAAERDVVPLATEWVRARDPVGSIWFLSHLGLQFYGERAGWKSVIPDQSRLTTGSWLVIPQRNFGQPLIELPTEARFEAQLSIPSRWLLSTMPWYHGTKMVIHQQHGPILTIGVYRIAADCTPRTPAQGGQSRP
jgi:hypothetical protein